MTVHSYLIFILASPKIVLHSTGSTVQTLENTSLGKMHKKKGGPHTEPKPPTFNGRLSKKKLKSKQSLRFYVYSETFKREVL